MTCVITDLQNNLVYERVFEEFELADRESCLEQICANILTFVAECGFDRSKILGLGVCIVGRVNTSEGRSFHYFTSMEESLREVIESRTGMRVLVENDTRARCYAE